MKTRLLAATALLVGSAFLTGCAGSPLIPFPFSSFGYSARSGSDSGSSASSGIDPITQAGIDADNAATNDQSNQDIRDATAAAVAASMNP